MEAGGWRIGKIRASSVFRFSFLPFPSSGLHPKIYFPTFLWVCKALLKFSWSDPKNLLLSLVRSLRFPVRCRAVFFIPHMNHGRYTEIEWIPCLNGDHNLLRCSKGWILLNAVTDPANRNPYSTRIGLNSTAKRMPIFQTSKSSNRSIFDINTNLHNTKGCHFNKLLI